MWASLLSTPHEITSAFKTTQATVVTWPSSVEVTFDGNASVYRSRGFGQQAALVIDQHWLSWVWRLHDAPRPYKAARTAKLQQQCGNNVVFCVAATGATNAAQEAGGDGKPRSREIYEIQPSTDTKCSAWVRVRPEAMAAPSRQTAKVPSLAARILMEAMELNPRTDRGRCRRLGTSG